MSQPLLQTALNTLAKAREAKVGYRLGVGVFALTTALIVGCTNPVSQADSQSYEAQLANHLKTSGAMMYGAYWCPHCAEQKELFDQAAAQLPYVECDANGENPQPQLCRNKGIQGYPTWEINGQLYPGTRSLDELAQLSGFQSNQSP
ncbi:MAG TPA: hypothetical protein V6D29_26105 [Leptolyngbyaceae cyanobacterium]